MSDLVEDVVVNELPDTVSIAQNLCVIMNEPLLDKNTQATFGEVNTPETVNGITKYILYLLKNNKKLDSADIPYFEQFVRLITHVVKRVDVGYMLLSELLTKKDK